MFFTPFVKMLGMDAFFVYQRKGISTLGCMFFLIIVDLIVTVGVEHGEFCTKLFKNQPKIC